MSPDPQAVAVERGELRIPTVTARTIQRLVDGPAYLLQRGTELDEATITLEVATRELARIEEAATELAINDPANTNDAKRKAAVKRLLAEDTHAQDARRRVEDARHAARTAARNFELAQNEFAAARSLARLLEVRQ